MRFLVNRLREASSWAGISAALGGLAHSLRHPVADAVLCVAAGAAILAVLLKDAGAADRKSPAS